ncbi:HEAT repeat domain-containing protein [Leucobacter sp. HY1908]
MPHQSAADSSHPAVPVSISPKLRMEVAVKYYGEAEVIDRALSLMDGNNEGEDFLLFVGGEHAQGILDGAPVLYWPELWGLRALLYVWHDKATPAVVNALHNTAWRVREMAARVIAARELPAATELTELLGDDTPRVRIAAARALGAVGKLDNVEDVRPLLKDSQVEVRRAAQQGIDALRARSPRS